MGLIDASALLHQHQRETIRDSSGKDVVLASMRDYEVAYRLCSRSLDLAIDELSSNARGAWESILGFKGSPFTRRGLMEKMRWSYWRTYSALRELTAHDLLGQEPGRSRQPTMYVARSAVPCRPEMGLLTPEELGKALSVAVGK